MDSRTTVFRLFNGLVQFVVPEYQRAYSWHVKQNNEQDCQVNQFLDDIKEQHKRHSQDQREVFKRRIILQL